MSCKELTTKGLSYVDASGNDAVIPRCNINAVGDHSKLTQEQRERWDAIYVQARLRYPHLCPQIIEIMLDFYIKHPDKFMEATGKDMEFPVPEEDVDISNPAPISPLDMGMPI